AQAKCERPARVSRSRAPEGSLYGELLRVLSPRCEEGDDFVRDGWSRHQHRVDLLLLISRRVSKVPLVSEVQAAALRARQHKPGARWGALPPPSHGGPKGPHEVPSVQERNRQQVEEREGRRNHREEPQGGGQAAACALNGERGDTNRPGE